MKTQVSYAILTGVTAILVAAAVPGPTAVGAQGNTPHDYVAPVVFQAAGPNPASIQSTIEQFRAALGGANNGNTPGPLAAGRREINWDGGGSATATAPTPFTGFLINRGALFTTPGSGFVQAPSTGLATTFGNLTYETIFQPFSPLRLFSAIGSNVTEVDFFVPGGGNVAATTTGFGAVFSDVDLPDGSGPAAKHGNRQASTRIEYYNAAGDLLYSSYVPASPGNASFSFLGIVFADARIAHVRIISGDAAPGVDDDAKRDIVMMDDFIYGEPRSGQ